MVSEKALKEIAKLNQKVEELEREKEWYKARGNNVQLDYQLRELSWKEYRRIDNKIYNVKDKIRVIEREGYSTSELSNLKKELIGFVTVQYNTSLGSRDLTKVGYSKTLKSFVSVSYTKWTSFMRNVKGCSSMAGKIDINSIRLITEAEFNEMKVAKVS